MKKNVLKHKESQTLELEWSTGLPSGTTTPSSSVLASDGFGAVLPTPFVLQPSELQIKFLYNRNPENHKEFVWCINEIYQCTLASPEAIYPRYNPNSEAHSCLPKQPKEVLIITKHKNT